MTPPDTSSNLLQRSIRNLYEAFSAYPLKKIVGCDHCTDASDIERLSAAPLERTSADDLSYFASSSILTLGDVDDLRHFLPRLLELLALEGDVGYLDAEIVLAHLRYGDWHEWPAGEREAVRGFLVAWWNKTLSHYPGVITADVALCSLAQVENELSAYLFGWRDATTPSAVRHLADFIAANVGPMVGRKAYAPPNFRLRSGPNAARRWIKSSSGCSARISETSLRRPSSRPNQLTTRPRSRTRPNT